MESLRSVWRQLEALVSEGLVRHLGVKGFPVSALEVLVAPPCNVPPEICQVGKQGDPTAARCAACAE